LTNTLTITPDFGTTTAGILVNAAGDACFANSVVGCDEASSTTVCTGCSVSGTYPNIVGDTCFLLTTDVVGCSTA